MTKEERAAAQREKRARINDAMEHLKDAISARDIDASMRCYGQLHKIMYGNKVKGNKYIIDLFGVPNPDPGTVRTFKEIGLRGYGGERLRIGESLAAFVARVGDFEIGDNEQSIRRKVGILNKKGFHIAIMGNAIQLHSTPIGGKA